MSNSWTVRLALASCTLLPLTGVAHGQDKVPPQKLPLPERQAQPPATQNQAAPRVAAVDRVDQQLAQMLIDGDDIEVAVSHAVVEKTNNDQVKSFAQKMVKEHAEAKQKLSHLTGLDATRQVPPAEVRRNAVSGQAPNAQPQNAQPRPAQQARQGNQSLDFMALSHELKEQCRTTALAEVDKKKGHELDACYIGMQLAAHKMTLDKLKVFKNHASPALQSHLDERQKSIEEHLELAEKVMKDLADESRKSAKND